LAEKVTEGRLRERPLNLSDTPSHALRYLERHFRMRKKNLRPFSS